MEIKTTFTLQQMIRTRFAPSPTGFLHIGGLRTALYNFLFAHKNKGTFILRIEDTDQARYVEGALESLLRTLQQMGLPYAEGPEKNGDFGPYIQSQRTELYRQHAQALLAKKSAYLCFCSSERLDAMRQRQTELKLAPMYDRTCLNLSAEEIETKKQSGAPYVIRQKIPRGGKLKFKDLIRGTVQFDTSTIDDQVLMKSDNFPTYHLANVVDDHLMEITHVIRGEEWLPSAPKHLLLYEAFGWQPPEFAHIPLLLNKDKTKLSKRQGDVSVESYLQQGYLPAAIINFIALLGWHPGKGEEQEIFSLEELIEKFSLENVHKAGAIFDVEKLNWFNFQWQKRLHHEALLSIAKELDPQATTEVNKKNETVYKFTSLEKEAIFNEKRGILLLKICEAYLPKEWLEQKELLLKALITIEEKILKTPKETKQNLEPYFAMKEYSTDLVLNPKMQVDKEIVGKALQASLKALENFNDYQQLEKIQNYLLELAQTLELKPGQLLWPMRVALSGEQFSPGVFELIWALGETETLNRLKKALAKHSV